MENDRYLSPKTITRKYNITSSTLRNWAEQGKIRFVRPLGTKRLYHQDDIRKIFEGSKSNLQKEDLKRKRILYARVSSSHQKEDLKRQIDYLQGEYPKDEVIKDIGSGLNWKRNGFETLLERIYQGCVSEIVVAYKDRLCRFGFELFEWICKKSHVKIVVLNPCTKTENREEELAEDLLSIVTVFVAKNNGVRASKNRKIRKSKESENNKDKTEPQQGTEIESQ
jgi:excisionase family DNA binding protein